MVGLDFDEWYRRERPKVVAAVIAITGRPSIADDVTDEAFTRAVERWGRVGQMDAPGGWVHRTALNAARRRLKRDGHERRLLRTVAAGMPAEAPPPTWPLDLWEALRSLPPREREAMVLRHVADLSVAEVAKVMGITPGTVGAALHAARARLAPAWDADPTTPRAPEATDA